MSWSAGEAASLAARYRFVPDLCYGDASDPARRLDLHVPAGGSPPAPTFVFFHGGGWVTGSKESWMPRLRPWLEAGWAAANVEYRKAADAPAPAAALDARRAVGWVASHARAHGLDPDRLVLGGMSSGGHLALLTATGGPLPGDVAGSVAYAAGADAAGGSGAAAALPDTADPPRVHAVVNWFGISDVAALLQGDRPRAFARLWLGRRPDARELARALSPLERVSTSTPPVISIHGDRDLTVPYEQSVRLHDALDRAGVRNRLLTIPGGGHGDFTEDEWASAYREIFEFLREH